ncbi:Undecaprenyl-phosphate glucose phosphotransferase [Clostridium sp. DSM 8431]|uniref:undecaprenyl-phosphate glucose phosphotransferase n=1 Tax=Clostridium sp. DSM 8431 TaxID=1761781 RepID=UPI0008E7C8DD|nr:undecaprenyl-phosphate glucose phosphotransferase [Clostridium sp. DSM 8431]SFU37823.1 Undecaprenyl-phosphate glucose phosphotransferase [Clostridium sp. DSM 8431]
MIKQNQKLINNAIVLLDAVVMVFSFLLTWYIRIHSGIMNIEGGLLSFRAYLIPVIIMIPVYILLYNFKRLYNTERTVFISNEIVNIITANVLGILVFTGLLFLTKQIDYSRAVLIIFFFVCTIFTSIERIIIRTFMRRARKKGLNVKYTVFVGYSEGTDKFFKLIKENKHWGYNVLGIFDDSNTKLEGMAYLGNLSELDEYLSENRDVDEIIITLEMREYDKIKNIIAICEKLGVRAQIIPGYYKYLPAKPYVEEIGGMPLINMRYIPLDNILNRFIKRSIDIIGSLIAIIIFSPIMLIVAVLVKTTSKGPLIFKQERVGLNRKPFTMYKFRSMRVQDPNEEKKDWTVKNDPRKTKIGTFIRKTSIDELPQFFNVLKGDMSLIGPRPERPYYVEKFKDEIPKYMVKHQVRPGITGWAQVNGWRGDTSIEKRIECDIYYIENWSLTLDIKIIFLTFFNGFINSNAY